MLADEQALSHAAEAAGAAAVVFSMLKAAADPLTAIVAGSALAAALLRPLPLARSFVLRAAVRRPLRMSRAWKVDADGLPRASALLEPDLGTQRPSRWWDVLSVPEARRRHRLIAALATPIRRAVDGEDVLPADLLSDVVSRPVRVPTPWPLFAHRLSRLAQLAATSRASGLLARVLYPEETRTVRAFLAEVGRHLQRFCEAEPVDARRIGSLATITPSATPPFPAFVTALSGALVLADSTGTRSGYIDEVLVWHARRYRTSTQGPTTGRRSATYEASHEGGGSCPLWDRLSRPVGDYDKRVLALEGVSLLESTHRGSTSFLLETSETCYAASEQGESAGGPTGPVGCKHVFPSKEKDEDDPLFDHVPWSGTRAYRLRRARPESGRTTLLTSYVSLITADGHLVLTRRSGQVRHGQDVISATAGGIVEPGGPGARGDVDAVGMPDLLETLRREAREEIGLDLSSSSVRPVCVFMTNIRNLGVPPRGGLGQLVAAVLYLCQVPDDFAELCRRVADADPALGGFEVDHLEDVPMGKLAGQGEETAAAALACYARVHADQLDQHGLLSCLYAAAVMDGTEQAAGAFMAAFPDKPWWDLESRGVHPRVVRDPRALLGAGLRTVDDAVPAWKGSWEGLGAALEQARLREQARRTT